MKEDVVEDVAKIEEGIVDRSGGRRMEGLYLAAGLSRCGLAGANMG